MSYGRKTTLIQGEGKRPVKTRTSSGTWSQHQYLSGWLLALSFHGGGRSQSCRPGTVSPQPGRRHSQDNGGTSSALPALPQESGDEDAGVQVERGVPPTVREVQDLPGESSRGSHGLLGLLPASFHSPGVRLTSPGRRVHSSGRSASGSAGYVWWSQASVVSLGWKWGVLSGGYRNQRWKTPARGQPPLPFPLQHLGLSPRGASPCLGVVHWGLFFSPCHPRARFSPSCQRSPRSNRGHASEREHRSRSLQQEVVGGVNWCWGETHTHTHPPRVVPVPTSASTHLQSQSCRQGWCPGCQREGARTAGRGGPTR